MSSIVKRMTGDKSREMAPSFTLSGATGEFFSLDAQRGVKRTLLIFYPQDGTSG